MTKEDDVTNERCIMMSPTELHRQTVMVKLLEKRLSQAKAALDLGLSIRQVQRLVAQYRTQGAAGLTSRKRGKTPNNVVPEHVRQHVLGIVRERYLGFGPTLVAEKLRENHQLYFAKETIRRWMMEAELWIPRAKRLKRAHQPRYRRECYGELVQIDGSQHAWFEDRGPKCTLLVYIDDATGKLMECQFVATESR